MSLETYMYEKRPICTKRNLYVRKETCMYESKHDKRSCRVLFISRPRWRAAASIMYTRHVASIELLGVIAGVWSIGEHVKRDVYIYKETSVCTKKELWNTPVERHTLDGTQSEHDKKEPISTKRRVYIYEK